MGPEANENGGQLAMVERVFSIIGPMVPKGSTFYLFGSFARNDARPSSDIDVAIDAGAQLPLSILAKIRYALEESNIPYAVDVIDMQRASETLRQSILREGLVWNDYAKR